MHAPTVKFVPGCPTGCRKGPGPGTTKGLVASVILLAGPMLAGAAVPGPGAGAFPAEVQVNLCSPPEEIVARLALRARGAPVEAWYFDTPGLDLQARGVLVRLRDTPGRAQLTLKLADRDCPRFDPALLPPAEAKCEYDQHGDQLKGAVSVNGALDAAAAAGLRSGGQALAKSLSPAQERVLREATTAWPLPGGLRAFGPVSIQAYAPAGKGKAYVVELWRLPSGRRYAEMSRKVDYADASAERARLEALLAAAGVTACADQSSQAAGKLRDLAGAAGPAAP